MDDDKRGGERLLSLPGFLHKHGWGNTHTPSFRISSRLGWGGGDRCVNGRVGVATARLKFVGDRRALTYTRVVYNHHPCVVVAVRVW